MTASRVQESKGKGTRLDTQLDRWKMQKRGQAGSNFGKTSNVERGSSKPESKLALVFVQPSVKKGPVVSF